MSKVYEIASPDGSFYIEDLSDKDAKEIADLTHELINQGEFKDNIRATIAAFVIWMSDRQIMAEPRDPLLDCIH